MTVHRIHNFHTAFSEPSQIRGHRDMYLMCECAPHKLGVVSRALARTRHAGHFDGELPFLTAFKNEKTSLKIVRMINGKAFKDKPCNFHTFPYNLSFLSSIRLLIGCCRDPGEIS